MLPGFLLRELKPKLIGVQKVVYVNKLSEKGTWERGLDRRL